MIELNLGSESCSDPASRTLPALGGKMSMFERQRVRHFSETSRLVGRFMHGEARHEAPNGPHPSLRKIKAETTMSHAT